MGRCFAKTRRKKRHYFIKNILRLNVFFSNFHIYPIIIGNKHKKKTIILKSNLNCGDPFLKRRGAYVNFSADYMLTQYIKLTNFLTLFYQMFA